jgi:hypothetical protein
MPDISKAELDKLKDEFKPLIGLRIDWLSIPTGGIAGFEPSQIAVIINTLLDAAMPQIELLASDPVNEEKLRHISLSKGPRKIGERESYPDYIHKSGKRVELKGLFVDNPDLPLKRPPTAREPSARIKENVTTNEVDAANDALLIAAVRLQEIEGRCCPVIIDIEVLSMIECIRKRDQRLIEDKGKWINGVPMVLSKQGEKKRKKKVPLTDNDYEKDTNFGKLKRIPYEPLQSFMVKHGTIGKHTKTGMKGQAILDAPQHASVP